MRIPIRSVWIAKLKAAKTTRAMTILLLVLLGIIAASVLAFGVSLTRLTLDDADFWLKVVSGIFAAIVFASGLAALVTGHFAGQAQAIKIQAQAEKMIVLEREAAEAKRSYLELLERVSPRSLSSQRTRMAEMLREFAKGKIGITCLNGNPESCGFAQELADLLKAVGWEVQGPTDMVLFTAAGQPPRGLFLTVKDGSNPPAHANALLQILNSSGFPTEGQQNPNLEEGKAALLVGVKP